MSFIQSLFILEQSGEVIIEKHWGSIVDRSVCEYYLAEVERVGGRQEIPSVITTPSHYIFHVERGDLAFVCTTQQEMPPLIATEFLIRVADILAEYFEECKAALVKAHFVTVYQLLDEMMDSGMPTTTETNILKEMIPPPSVVNRIASVMTGNAGVIASNVLPGGAQSSVPWRRAGCRYTNNEIFFDIVESLDVTLDSDGRILSGAIYGELYVNSRLSGMPDLTLSFSNVGMLDDVRFHPCVRYARYSADRVLSFVPPDGPCKLMSYKVREMQQSQYGPKVNNLPLPMYVKPNFSFSESTGRMNVMVGPRVELGKPLEGVLVRVPLPVCVSSIDIQANHGVVSYDDKTKVILWDIGRIPRDKAPILSGILQLDRTRDAAGAAGLTPDRVSASYAKNKVIWDDALALEASFRVEGAGMSGLTVDSLHLVNETYKLYKGVRYTSKSGRFVIRA